MKRYVVSIAIVLAVLMVAFKAFGQNQERAGRTEQRQDMRERFQNMSPEEREKFRAEMLETRKKWEDMSDEDRAKLRDQMRERFGIRAAGIRRDEQVNAIKAIEEQVARLKAAVDVTAPENRDRLRELPEDERAKLREKMMTAMRERQTAIRAIEQELAKLKGPGRPATESEARLNELRAIHKLAVKEKATQTADRLDKLIIGYQRGSVGGDRPPVRGPREGEPRPRRERPARQGNP
ncbi:MAG TPA: hypothetical protein VMX36_07100 [Sedimentisphaerales bacterium]|nr:hypothetical protein [Sedimentisphaerales bacterium]